MTSDIYDLLKIICNRHSQQIIALSEENDSTQKAIALLHEDLSIVKTKLDRILSRQEKQHVEVGYRK